MWISTKATGDTCALACAAGGLARRRPLQFFSSPKSFLLNSKNRISRLLARAPAAQAGYLCIFHSYWHVSMENKNLTLEGIRGEGGNQSDPPSIFFALNFCSLTEYQKLWHNCSLFVKTSFDSN